jgi:hypothetical protein
MKKLTAAELILLAELGIPESVAHLPPRYAPAVWRGVPNTRAGETASWTQSSRIVKEPGTEPFLIYWKKLRSERTLSFPKLNEQQYTSRVQR